MIHRTQKQVDKNKPCALLYYMCVSGLDAKIYMKVSKQNRIKAFIFSATIPLVYAVVTIYELLQSGSWALYSLH